MKTQRKKRRGVAVSGELITVAAWYQCGHFRNDEQARGAFELAYQQGMDGAGRSVREHMGLTDEEFCAWMRDQNWLPGQPTDRKSPVQELFKKVLARRKPAA